MNRPLPSVPLRSALLAAALLASACAAGPDPAPPGAFSLVALPDTQRYTHFSPEVFHRQIRWILDNARTQRIVFVTHLGDIVESNTRSEWQIASAAMKPLEGVIPFGLGVGNHDIGRRTSDLSGFTGVFPASRFSAFAWYGGGYPDGTNQSSFQTFEAGEMKFLVLHLVCNAPDDVLEWARQVIESHQDRRVIVTTHMFLGAVDRPDETEGVPQGPTGVMRWTKVFGDAGNSSEQIWEKLLSRYPRIFLILSGDQSSIQALHATLRGREGNAVHAAMSDYGDGSFRLYRFLPSENRIQAMTYSVEIRGLVHGTEEIASAEAHQFSMDYDMSSGR